MLKVSHLDVYLVIGWRVDVYTRNVGRQIQIEQVIELHEMITDPVFGVFDVWKAPQIVYRWTLTTVGKTFISTIYIGKTNTKIVFQTRRLIHISNAHDGIRKITRNAQ